MCSEVCMDGTPAAYHLDPGSRDGNNSWIVNLEGGGWCNNARTCRFRKGTRRGSSDHMEKRIAFTGIMSSSPADNPDFYNWNRVKIRYRDGASFASDGLDKALFSISVIIAWFARVNCREMGSTSGANASGTPPSGTSSPSGWPRPIRCCSPAAPPVAWLRYCTATSSVPSSHPPAARAPLSSASPTPASSSTHMVDVSGGRSLRSYYSDIVAMQGVARSLPPTCTDHLDPTSCFFPQNVIDGIKTPIFLLNSAYDVWQIEESQAPNRADPTGGWRACKFNRSACTETQMKILQGFRDQMVAAVKGFSGSKANGLFVDSCFAHCQSELQATWNAGAAGGSPAIQSKGIAKSVGDRYFGRAEVKAIDCPYPCDTTCRHII